MTELEEAGLTEGQSRALSAHRSRAYQGYAKRTVERALAATRRRHAYRLGTQGEPISERAPDGVSERSPGRPKGVA